MTHRIHCCDIPETLLSIKFEGIMEFFRELPNKVRMRFIVILND